MNHSVIEPENWMSFLLVLVISFFIIIGSTYLLRRKLGADAGRFFAKPVNEVHKKWDWALRILYIIMIIVTGFIGYPDPIYFLWVVIVYLISESLLQALMEWKYAENRMNYKMTLIELVLYLILLLGVVIYLSFQGLL
ncbi:DUF4181 domain-containing protein [Halobacillus massiliensis]|uniref:DUF4181 domain-containing protein n=1 Tax=Halobacillus massiliensis TaxID=1926286 RepID=UPI0009E4BC84|nr:DUF4181 domain-containing protein [Halobacillus massiliensis]